MRKTIALTILLAFALSACGSTAGILPGSPAGGSSFGGSGSSSGGGFASPTVPGLQLAAGMIKLDGTPYQVTSQEAARLLPMWKNLQQQESAAATAAATEAPTAEATPGGTPQFRGRFNPQSMQQVAADLSAIENAMPSDQLQAIQQMNLNRQDVADILQQAGIQMGTFDNGTPQARFGNGGTFTAPNGTPRAFGTLGANGTPGAFDRGGFGARGAFASFIPPQVVDGIVQWLQKKAAS